MKKKFKEIIARRTSALFLAVTLVAGMLFPALTAEAGWKKIVWDGGSAEEMDIRRVYG